MISLIQTAIICVTVLAAICLFCRYGVMFTLHLHHHVDQQQTPRQADMLAYIRAEQEKANAEYEQQRKTAYAVAREVQSLFLDEDQMDTEGDQ